MGQVLDLLPLKILVSYERSAALIVVARPRACEKFPLNKGGCAEGAGVVLMSAEKLERQPPWLPLC